MASPVHPYSDYGVALRQLRSARGVLGWMLAIAVLVQLAGFSLLVFTQQPYVGMHPTVQVEKTWFDVISERLSKIGSDPSAATQPVKETVATPAIPAPAPMDFLPPSRLNIRTQWNTTYTLAVPMTQIAGIVSAASQVVLVFLTLLVILVAQAPGVSQVTRSLIWTVVLFFLVFPWQTLARDFPIPGFLYSYSEMLRFIAPHVTHQRVYGFETLLLYARFIAYPIFGLLLLLIAAERFRAGLMLAIGHPLQSMMVPKAGPIGPERKIG